MVLNRIYDSIASKYRSFYRPANIDIAYSRQRTLAVFYLVSSLGLFLYSLKLLGDTIANPESRKMLFETPPVTIGDPQKRVIFSYRSGGKNKEALQQS